MLQHLVNEKQVFPIPLHIASELAQGRPVAAAKQWLDVAEGQLHRRGSVWKIPFCLYPSMNGAAEALVDTGAQPTICKASALEKLDPDWRDKLSRCGTSGLTGLGGKTEVLGVYKTSIILPHAKKNLVLPRVEILIAENFSLPYDFIFGQDLGAMYHFQFLRPSRRNAHLKIGPHEQLFYLSGSFDIAAMDFEGQQVQKIHPPQILKGMTVPSPNLSKEFQPGAEYSHITFEKFQQVLTEDIPCSEDFEKALDTANVFEGLSAIQKKQMMRILRANESAFALEGKAYDRPQLGEKLVIPVEGIPNPIPKALRKMPYPISHKAKQDMATLTAALFEKKCIQRSDSPFSSPSIIVYNKEKPRMVHDYKEINKYIHASAHPLPHLWSLIEMIGKSNYLFSFDLLGAFHNMWLDEESRKYMAFCTPDGLFEYLTGCFGINCMPPEFQKRMENLF